MKCSWRSYVKDWILGSLSRPLAMFSSMWYVFLLNTSPFCSTEILICCYASSDSYYFTYLLKKYILYWVSWNVPEKQCFWRKITREVPEKKKRNFNLFHSIKLHSSCWRTEYNDHSNSITRVVYQRLSFHLLFIIRCIFCSSPRQSSWRRTRFSLIIGSPRGRR